VTDSLYLAWRYIRYNRLKTLTLVGSITLIAALPLVLQLLLAESERQLLSRAVSTPLVVGAKGSALDLVMNSLYFSPEMPERISLASAEQVADTGLARSIPLYVRFQARGFPIVGTALDYFDFRRLRLASGRRMALLGECVLGAEVAQRLGLVPGDTLVSSPETLFDLAGVYPLKMRISGVLTPTHGPDDRAVFVDVKTAWVIQGLGHGHQDLAVTDDESVVLARSEGGVVANAKLVQYTEITPETVASFHFHGPPTAYPLTAVLAVPADARSGTILRGRFAEQGLTEQGLTEQGLTEQVVVPSTVIEGLLQNVFRFKSVLDAVIAVVALATALSILLVFALSLRLRQGEIETIFKLGCRRSTIGRLLAAEVLLILLLGAASCGVLLTIADYYAADLVRAVFIG
jgi:putative ABC transport system permease protein